MAQSNRKQVYTRIPTQVNEKEFDEFFLPYLSIPKRGPKCKIGYWKVFNLILKILYTGIQWKELPIDKTACGEPEVHYTSIYKQYARWSDDGSLLKSFEASVQLLSDEEKLDISILNGDGSNTVAKKGGDGIGYSGHKHQKGEKVLAIVDKNGFVVSPYTISPVNINDCSLLPDSLGHLSEIARNVGFSLKGSVLNLDGVFDSKKTGKQFLTEVWYPIFRKTKEIERKRKEVVNAYLTRGFMNYDLR